MFNKQNDPKLQEALLNLKRLVEARGTLAPTAEQTGRLSGEGALLFKNNTVPSKRQTRLRGPITRGSRVALGSESAKWNLAFLIRAIAASETGCRTATEKELERIKRSARNCNTTEFQKGLY